ncbi:CdiA family toxin C-terminal domain-containing protein [Photorhabdus hindustanensis]|uniref:CdiA family toxin C-terminal domain-containing protein n=1 Tax=Photorhabdus hindustanensis TaxID=2918802 RepID=UPI0015E27DD6|nr:CdiA family toxin C-terminal domain-containing protein [Photorhabdus hindustanensis]
MKGIIQVSYLIPTKDREGNITGLKGMGPDLQPFVKTIYDPKIHSDKKMLELGQQAAASGYKEAISSGKQAYDAKAGGIEFRVYLDPATGRVNNFHPK